MLASPPGLPASSVLGRQPGPPLPLKHRHTSMAALRAPSSASGAIPLALADPGLQQKVAWPAAATAAHVPLPGSSMARPNSLWASPTPTALVTLPSSHVESVALAEYSQAPRVRRASCSLLPSHAFAATGAALGSAVGSPQAMLAGAPPARRRQSFLLASASTTLQ